MAMQELTSILESTLNYIESAKKGLYDEPILTGLIKIWEETYEQLVEEVGSHDANVKLENLLTPYIGKMSIKDMASGGALGEFLQILKKQAPNASPVKTYSNLVKDYFVDNDIQILTF